MRVHWEAHISKLRFRSSALLRLLFGSQIMLQEQASPKAGRTSPVYLRRGMLTPKS